MAHGERLHRLKAFWGIKECRGISGAKLQMQWRGGEAGVRAMGRN